MQMCIRPAAGFHHTNVAKAEVNIKKMLDNYMYITGK